MTKPARYVDLTGTSNPTTWDEVFAAANRIQRFFNDIKVRYVERDELIDKIMYAVMLREHVLLIGPTGTGKSHLLDSILGSITDAQVWSMDLTKFTGDTHLFGSYDVRAMKEDGHMRHMTEGSLAEANFGKTGEFFDASDPTLRTLLGVMNERRVRRGPQTIDLPLITLVADTNFAPEDMPNRRHQLEAVVDRFMFQCRVSYVKDPRNRYRLLEMALERGNQIPSASLHMDDIILVSGVVHEMDMISDPYVREAYQEMTFDFSEARQEQGKPPLSDRRYVKAAQIMEIGALLHERQVVTFDDLQYTTHILAQDEDDARILQEIKAAALDNWVAKAQRREIDAELHKLAEHTNKIPQPDLSQLTHAEIRSLKERLREIRDELSGFDPQSIEVRAKHTEALTGLHRLMAQADLQQIDLLTSHVPELPEQIDPANLKPLMDQCRQIEAELRSIEPKSDEAIVRLAHALELTGKTIATIHVEFMSAGAKAI